MLNPNAQKWVEALRSGKYQQGSGHLRPLFDKYCCLGVACEVYAHEHDLEWSQIVSADVQMDLPEDVQEWLGLASPYGEYENGNLVTLNDTLCWSFQKIADFVESEPQGLFK